MDSLQFLRGFVTVFSGEVLLEKTQRATSEDLVSETYGGGTSGSSFGWSAVLDALKKELYFPPPWLSSIKVKKADGGKIALVATSQFQADWIKTHYLSLINEISERINGDRHLEIIIEDTDSKNSKERPSRGSRTRQSKSVRSNARRDVKTTNFPSFLSSTNSFENFVVGSSNQFAHAACCAIAEKPGLAYNPLFIHSGVGLGKTHLLHSIGNHIRKNQLNNMNIFCISAEHFTNGVVQSIRTGSMESFRNLYRFNCDVLLIDDIQFIAGKESTQEEFFHTFNSLYTAKKQIVITSDKPTSAMKDFEERLKSRFDWGLAADIQPPETETKIVIIEKKAQEEKIEIPNEVASFIAQNVLSNIRELEGSLNKLFAYSKMFREPITLETTKQLLKNLVKKEKPKMITIDLIQKEVCGFFNISAKEIKSGQKQKKISEPRQIAMFLARKYTSSSFAEIGEKFGGKNHATAVHAVKNVEKKLSNDSSVSNSVAIISRNLENFIIS